MDTRLGRPMRTVVIALVVAGFAAASGAQTTTKDFGSRAEFNLESDPGFTSSSLWSKFLGAEFDDHLSIGGISGSPDQVIFSPPTVRADTRSGVKISADVSGKAGIELSAGFDVGGVQAHGDLDFGPTLTYPTQLQIGREYSLTGSGAASIGSDFSVDTPSLEAHADAMLDFHVDGKAEYGLFPLVPYDVAPFGFDFPNLDLHLFDVNLNLKLTDLPDFNLLGIDLPIPPNEDDSLLRFKLPPNNPQLSLGEVQIVNPAKNFQVAKSVSGSTARFELQGDLVRLGADLDGLVTSALFGNAILGTEVDVGELGKLKYDLINFKYGPEIGFKYEAEITPEVHATLHFSSDVLVRTDQGLERTDTLEDVAWDQLPDVVLISDQDVNVDVTFDSLELMMEHHGALTLDDYLEIRALELSASLKAGFAKIPLGKLGPVIDKKYSPLGDLFGKLEVDLFHDTKGIGVYDLSGLGWDDSFTLDAMEVAFAYAVDSTGPLDATGDWRLLDDHSEPGNLASATLVVGSGDNDSGDLADLQPIVYTDQPSMITETYKIDLPFPLSDQNVNVTHQDFDRIVDLQGLRVVAGSTYEVPDDTVRRLRTVSLHNDGLIHSTGFFELTSPGVILLVSGEGTVDLERAAAISAENMVIDAGQTIHFSHPGNLNIEVVAHTDTPLGPFEQTVDQFSRSGFSFDVSDTLDMEGELLVDGALLNLRALGRLSIGTEGALRAINGAPQLAVTTPLLVNEGEIEATNGSSIDLYLPPTTPRIEGGSDGGEFFVGDGSLMTVATGDNYVLSVSNARFRALGGGDLQFLSRISVDDDARFDLTVDAGGRAELRGLVNKNIEEGHISIVNQGMLEITASSNSLRPTPDPISQG